MNPGSMLDSENRNMPYFKTFKDVRMVNLTQVGPGNYVTCSMCMQHGFGVKIYTPNSIHHHFNETKSGTNYCPCLKAILGKPPDAETCLNLKRNKMKNDDAKKNINAEKKQEKKAK